MPYAKSFLRFMGACGLPGGVELVIPRCLGIARVLTPLAAAGLAVITFVKVLVVAVSSLLTLA